MKTPATTNETTEWIFTFKSGGWNSVWATNKKEAIKIANQKFGKKSIHNMEIIENSFMEVEKNKAVYQNYLSMFY